MKSLPPKSPHGCAPLEPLIYIVDDDPGMNDALANLLRSVGMRSRSFLTAEEFLAVKIDDSPSCVVLDVRLRVANGLEVQREMNQRGMCLPVVFITGYGDIEMSVRAMKAGAVDFLTKPFRDQDMLDAVASALARDSERLLAEQSGAALRTSFEALTQREREVLRFVVAGLMNKQIAAELNLSEVTVKVHRGQVMKKLGARSVADLVRMAETLGVEPSRRAT